MSMSLCNLIYEVYDANENDLWNTIRFGYIKCDNDNFIKWNVSGWIIEILNVFVTFD